MIRESPDVLILGAGSAGFGAAYRALCSGLSVVLADANPGPGGTAVFAGVNCWEPGIAGGGVHRELARRLLSTGDAFVGKTTVFCSAERPYAVSDRCDDPYESTLRRAGLDAADYRRFHFEPEAMSRVMDAMLTEADPGGRLLRLYRTVLSAVTVEDRSVVSVSLRTPDGERTFLPRLVIDCSGDIALARAAGCACVIGEPGTHLNGISRCFRVSRTAPEDGIPERETPPEGKRTVSCLNAYPRGGYNVNMLPTVEGDCLLRYPPDELERVTRQHVLDYWGWLRRFPALRGYHLESIFPMTGIREGFRLQGRYVLAAEDLRRGTPAVGENHVVCMADHPCDMHGEGYLMQPNGAYGIPYECMLPCEFDNFLVACRGASFSHTAASSARLSRTMLALGEAAGNAAAFCARNGILPPDIPDNAIAGLRA